MTRPDIQYEKRTCQTLDLDVPVDQRIKLKESEKRDKYIDLARELKSIEHEGCRDTNCNWSA